MRLLEISVSGTTRLLQHRRRFVTISPEIDANQVVEIWPMLNSVVNRSQRQELSTFELIFYRFKFLPVPIPHDLSNCVEAVY